MAEAPRLSVPTERRRVLAVVLVAAVLRIVVAATIGLGVDESYAVALSHRLSLSYFDHPPLVFWIVAITARVFGTRHDVLLRLPFIALFVATTWLLYRLTARLYGERAGLYAAVLVSVIPVFGVADGGWILPDGPLLFGFAGAALALAHIAKPSRVRAGGDQMGRWWLAAALGVGVAALSKYHAVFLVAGALLFFATSSRQRHWLARPAPYLSAAMVVAMGLPVLIWNATHGWVSFRFQSGRASLGTAHLAPLLENLAGQAGYMLPWIWLPLAWLFVSAAVRGPRDRTRWLLVCLGGGPVVVFTGLALAGRPGLPHWPAPGWLLLVPLLANELVRLERRGHRRVVRWSLVGSAAIVMGLVAIASLQIATGWLSRRDPQWFTRGDPSLDAVDWREAGAVLEAEARVEGVRMFVAADWIDAAKLGAALPDVDGSAVLCFSDDPRHFGVAEDQRVDVGKNALVVFRTGPRSGFAEARRRIGANFRSLDSVTTLDIRRDGETVVQLAVYRGEGLLHPYASPTDR